MDDRTGVLLSLAQAMARQSQTDPLPHRLCRSATLVLGADGGAITIAYSSEDRVTLCVTDGSAARLEDLQDVLGEGPGHTAYRTGTQVLAIVGAGDARWPQFDASASEAFGKLGVHAIPIRPDHRTLGVLTCHLPPANELLLSPRMVQFLADAVGVALLRDPEAHETETDDYRSPWASRSRIHQATGMVVAQLGIDTGDALVLLRAHAFAQGTALDDIAEAVVGRVLDLSGIDSGSAGS
ncbi:GAF and ANTAR domain-containing protein [Terrabacter sp. NPDC080008]|uniref:GAF and ANTAR domain-containing protein n=1 Tax=Terrabacter sp. NPDC080008 TaxID=3155176 RepID=UPI00344F5690